MTTNIQIKSNPSINELIGSLSQLDSSTLNYLVASLQQIQRERTQNLEATAAQRFWSLIDLIDWSASDNDTRLKPLSNGEKIN